MKQMICPCFSCERNGLCIEVLFDLRLKQFITHNKLTICGKRNINIRAWIYQMMMLTHDDDVTIHVVGGDDNDFVKWNTKLITRDSIPCA